MSSPFGLVATVQCDGQATTTIAAPWLGCELCVAAGAALLRQALLAPPMTIEVGIE
jgi:hypothetical protein